MTTSRRAPQIKWFSCYAILLFFVVSCVKPSTSFLPEFNQIDLLIENGFIIDGSGKEAFPSDIVIVKDRIVFIGKTKFTNDDYKYRIIKKIDADNRFITPGFIDLHSHGDPLETPSMENFLAMGVTTITLGQDGSSPAVQDLSKWMDQVSEKGIGVNLAMFVGHGTLRNLSGIGRSNLISDSKMSGMLDTLNETLKYTFGLSTGLEYNPGLNASLEELIELAKIVGKNNRMIMSHLRNEDDDQIENSIAELLEQGRYSKVHIAHLKSVYGKGRERAEEIIEILEKARTVGIDITADIYPYNASYTGIGIIFPTWAKTIEEFNVAKIERRNELEEYLINRVNLRNGPEAVLLGTDPYTGMTLSQLSHEKETPFEDILIDLIGPEGVSGAYFVMNNELQTRFLIDSNIGISSDGSPTGFHPRGHGTFAKVIEKYVVNEGLLSLEAAIYKMTSFAASILGITERGQLKSGMIADLLIFDASKVKAIANYTDPFEYADGFDVVIINGNIARENGELVEGFFGRVLQPNLYNLAGLAFL